MKADPRRDVRGSSRSSRQAALIQLVTAEGYCSAAELSRQLCVSEITIRRDIKELAERGLVRSVYGGITTLADAALTGTEFSARSVTRMAQKRSVAREAARRILPATTIAFDSGTTILELAKLVPADAGLNIVTASLPVMSMLAQNAGIRLIALGGTFHAESQSFAGEDTNREAMSRSIDVFFLSASAVRQSRIFCGSYFDAEVKRALISRAREVIVITDSSKFGLTGPLVMVASASDVSTIITDDEQHDSVLTNLGDGDIVDKLVFVSSNMAPSTPIR